MAPADRGDFNIGITDTKQLEKFIADKRKTGVYLSIFGVGEGNLNDALIQRLAQAGNGNAACIDSLLEARKAMSEELGSTMFPIANDVKVQVAVAAGATHRDDEAQSFSRTAVDRVRLHKPWNCGEGNMDDGTANLGGTLFAVGSRMGEKPMPSPNPLKIILLAAALSIAPLPARPAPHAAQAAACLTAQNEDTLKARETALLGRSHAEEHAETRARRCRVALGLEKEQAGPPAGTLAAAAAISPELAGRWSAPFTVPVAGITAVLLNTGKVLFWTYDPAHYQDPDASNTGVSYLWDPASRSGHFLVTPENIWCGGQTLLADGRVFLAGGNLRFPDPRAPDGERGWKGALSTYTFNPATAAFIKQPDMSAGRWYPTVTQLADNSAIITSGYDETGSQGVNPVVERFMPSPAIDGAGTLAAVGNKNTTGLYPFQYLLPSGAMLQAGPERSNAWLLAPGSWTWSRLPHMLYDHEAYGNGIIYTDASVQPVSQIITIAGGKTGASNNEWLDGFDPAAGWHDYPKWNVERHNANTVILPDGKLLTIGGNASRDNYGGTLFSAELYSGAANDVNGAWIEVDPNRIPAAYHSSAILLPDATVLLSEDDRSATVKPDAHRMQVYSPPYLFRGPRPTLAAPAVISRGQSFGLTAAVPTSRRVAGAVLIAPAAVTHGNDMHQRFIKLAISVSGGAITAAVPAPAALVPPGYYMLFIVDSAGVPSTASFVRVE